MPDGLSHHCLPMTHQLVDGITCRIAWESLGFGGRYSTDVRHTGCRGKCPVENVLSLKPPALPGTRFVLLEPSNPIYAPFDDMQPAAGCIVAVRRGHLSWIDYAYPYVSKVPLVLGISPSFPATLLVACFIATARALKALSARW